MPVTYRVEVLHRNVNRIFLRGGDGYRFMDRLRAAMHRRCEIEARSTMGNKAPPTDPEWSRRPGPSIAQSHRSYARGRGGYRTDVRVENIAPHAPFVHGGTQGPIRPRGAALSTPYGAKKSVRGQAANPWLERACVAVSRTRGAVGA